MLLRGWPRLAGPGNAMPASGGRSRSGSDHGSFRCCRDRLRDQVEAVLGQVLDVDREVAPQLVEQRGGDLLAVLGVVVPQRLVGAVPGLLVGGDLGRSRYLIAQQAGLLQVRHGDPPAALQVQVEPVADDLPQRPYGLGPSG